MNILSLILFHRNCFTIVASIFQIFFLTQLAEWDYRSLDLEKIIFVKLYSLHHDIFPFKSNDIFRYFDHKKLGIVYFEN